MFTELKTGWCNAWIFMCVFIIQMFVMMFGKKGIMEKTHGAGIERKTFLEKKIPLIANLLCFVALAYSIFLPLKVGTAWFYTGLSIFVTGTIILFIATYDFMTTPFDQVIQSGVYAFSRNPLYLSASLIYFGAGISTGSLIFIGLTIIITLSLHYEILLEEKYCLNLYQENYREYMKRVPRWVGKRIK